MQLEANTSIEVPRDGDWIKNASCALGQIKAASGPEGVEAVFHVAGGWVGGSVSDSDFLQSVDDMVKRNLVSATTTAYFAGNDDLRSTLVIERPP